MALSPAGDQASSNTAKEARREKESMRMLSLGVPVPKAVAGPKGSSSKKNPFAFPEYTSPVETPSSKPHRSSTQEEGEVAVEELVPLSSRPSSPAEIEVYIPAGLRAQWNDYVR